MSLRIGGSTLDLLRSFARSLLCQFVGTASSKLMIEVCYLSELIAAAPESSLAVPELPCRILHFSTLTLFRHWAVVLVSSRFGPVVTLRLVK